MPFERFEIDGKEYWREIPVQNPDIQICAVGSISGQGIPEEGSERERWEEWYKYD